MKILLEARVWLLRIKFRENRPLFIGLLIPCHREQGALPVLTISRLQIIAYTKKSKRGRILTRRSAREEKKRRRK
jgi:hypothetical protein